MRVMVVKEQHNNVLYTVVAGDSDFTPCKWLTAAEERYLPALR